MTLGQNDIDAVVASVPGDDQPEVRRLFADNPFLSDFIERRPLLLMRPHELRGALQSIADLRRAEDQFWGAHLPINTRAVRVVLHWLRLVRDKAADGIDRGT